MTIEINRNHRSKPNLFRLDHIISYRYDHQNQTALRHFKDHSFKNQRRHSFSRSLQMFFQGGSIANPEPRLVGREDSCDMSDTASEQLVRVTQPLPCHDGTGNVWKMIADPKRGTHKKTKTRTETKRTTNTRRTRTTSPRSAGLLYCGLGFTILSRGC